MKAEGKIPPAAAAHPLTDGITEDAILGGRLRLRQPAAGYRVGIDPVFLAAAAPSLGQRRVLDLGCGVGAAALCLASRQPGVSIVGLELQPDLAGLAACNVELNGFAGRIQILAGDLLRLPPEIADGAFDLVLANPPFHAAGRASAPAEAGRALGHMEGKADLATWIDRSLALLGPKGMLLMIHKPERLGEILAGLNRRAGGIVVFPLLPAVGRPAIRVLVRALKGSAAALRLAAGLVLHDGDGRYSDAAEAVLRHGAALEI